MKKNMGIRKYVIFLSYVLCFLFVSMITGAETISAAGSGFLNCKDVFIASGDSFGDVYIHPAQGDGTFSAKMHIGSIDGESLGVAVDDFDNDGDLDVTVQSLAGSSFLFTNNGDLSFVKTVVAQGLSFGWYTRYGAANADFNNDGYADYISPSIGSFVYLFTNNQDNTFTVTEIPAPVLENPAQLRLLLGMDTGDFNEDGNMDFLVSKYNAYSSDPNSIYLFSGNGTGTFSISLAFTNANNGVGDTIAVAAGDFNNDGHLDAVVGADDDGDPGQTWIYVGDGTGAFFLFGEAYDTNPAVEYGFEYPGGGINDAYDFDGDGNLDIIQNAGGFGMAFVKGNGDGTFQDPVIFDTYSGRGMSAPPIDWPLRWCEVLIDIKPGSDPNCFNNNGNGVIPVAILGDPYVDVRNIDPGSIMLEGLDVRVVGKSNKLLAHYEDVNLDGYEDLVVQIEDSDMVFTEGDTSATLTGFLYDGASIEGTDAICIVP